MIEPFELKQLKNTIIYRKKKNLEQSLIEKVYKNLQNLQKNSKKHRNPIIIIKSTKNEKTKKKTIKFS